MTSRLSTPCLHSVTSFQFAIAESQASAGPAIIFSQHSFSPDHPTRPFPKDVLSMFRITKKPQGATTAGVRADLSVKLKWLASYNVVTACPTSQGIVSHKSIYSRYNRGPYINNLNHLVLPSIPANLQHPSGKGQFLSSGSASGG